VIVDPPDDAGGTQRTMSCEPLIEACTARTAPGTPCPWKVEAEAGIATTKRSATASASARLKEISRTSMRLESIPVDTQSQQRVATEDSWRLNIVTVLSITRSRVTEVFGDAFVPTRGL
jgi:hypothetical protein